MSTRTEAPAARARSEGANVLTKGTATAAPPTAPTPQVMAIQVRRLLSTGSFEKLAADVAELLAESLMGNLCKSTSGSIVH
jgi:hypothetical protein